MWASALWLEARTFFDLSLPSTRYMLCEVQVCSTVATRFASTGYIRVVNIQFQNYICIYVVVQSRGQRFVVGVPRNSSNAEKDALVSALLPPRRRIPYNEKTPHVRLAGRNVETPEYHSYYSETTLHGSRKRHASKGCVERVTTSHDNFRRKWSMVLLPQIRGERTFLTIFRYVVTNLLSARPVQILQCELRRKALRYSIRADCKVSVRRQRRISSIKNMFSNWPLTEANVDFFAKKSRNCVPVERFHSFNPLIGFWKTN